MKIVCISFIILTIVNKLNVSKFSFYFMRIKRTFPVIMDIYLCDKNITSHLNIKLD